MLGVKIEISRAAVSRGIDASVVERRLSAAVSHRLGPEIRERVQERADLGGQTFPGWSMRPRWLATAPGYPDRAQGRPGPSGVEYYRPASIYHRMNGTHPGSYATTGGMWSGLSTVVKSERQSFTEFRGRSMGRDPSHLFRKTKRSRKSATAARKASNKRRAPRKATRREKKAPTGRQINNVLKAWTVLAKHKINVLALSRQEFEAVARIALYAMAMGASATLPIDWPTRVPGTMGEIVARAFEGSL